MWWGCDIAEHSQEMDFNSFLQPPLHNVGQERLDEAVLQWWSLLKLLTAFVQLSIDMLFLSGQVMLEPHWQVNCISLNTLLFCKWNGVTVLYYCIVLNTHTHTHYTTYQHTTLHMHTSHYTKHIRTHAHSTQKTKRDSVFTSGAYLISATSYN